MRRRLVVSGRRFGTTYRFNPQGFSILTTKPALRKFQEERTSQQYYKNNYFAKQ
jgi:hypothetical protein